MKKQPKPKSTVDHTVEIKSTQEELKIDISVKGFAANIWVDRKQTKVLDEIVQRAMPMLMAFGSRLQQEQVSSVVVEQPVPKHPDFKTTTTIPPRIMKAYKAYLAAEDALMKNPTAKNRAAMKRASDAYRKLIDAWSPPKAAK